MLRFISCTWHFCIKKLVFGLKVGFTCIPLISRNHSFRAIECRVSNNGKRFCTLQGWEICSSWTNNSTSWHSLIDIKNSFPVQLAKYAKKNGLDQETAFKWWVRHAIKKEECIIKAVTSRYSQRMHKFGIYVPHSVQEALKIDPTSMSNPCKVFDKLHMQWMCIWMRPYNIKAALLHQAFGSHLECWVTPRQQMMVNCSDWGCGPNQDWSHVNVKPMQCVWQPFICSGYAYGCVLTTLQPLSFTKLLEVT